MTASSTASCVPMSHIEALLDLGEAPVDLEEAPVDLREASIDLVEPSVHVGTELGQTGPHVRD